MDLAYNNLSGIVPKSIVNWKGMALRDEKDDAMDYGISFVTNAMVEYNDNFTAVKKGQEQPYTGEIVYMVNLDYLSCNNLNLLH
jgi:hypothetical protein